MSRKQFIESHGATCANWAWSWSFINHTERFIIFGAWDNHTQGSTSLILSEDWSTNAQGHQNNGYPQSREHIRLIEEESFRLLTFPMTYAQATDTGDGNGPARIDGFIPKLTERTLTRVGSSWYASDGHLPSALTEELAATEKYIEGAQKTVTINAYERNSKARKACISHYGATCSVCDFDFGATYGALGEGFIHVHHIVPLGSIRAQYEIDPIHDLVPICPNCHAMIHLTMPPLSIAQLRSHIHEIRTKSTEQD